MKNWKRSWRNLLSLKDTFPELKDVQVFTIGRDVLPFLWNPFRQPPGSDKELWISTIAEVLEKSHISGPGVAHYFNKIYSRLLKGSGDDFYPNFFDGLKELNNIKAYERELRWNGGNIDNSIIDEYYGEVDRKGIKAKTRASAIEILKPVNLKKAIRTLEFTDGVVTTVSDEAIMDAMAVVGKNGFGCEPASAATVAGTKKLVAQGIIGADESVVGIATGHMLKDVTAVVDYHFNPKSRFANTPITVEPDIKEILKLVDD